MTNFNRILPLDHLAQMLDESVPIKKRIDLLQEQIELYKEVTETLRNIRNNLVDSLGEE